MAVRDYALALLCVLGVNLLPAFGPPTWAVLVFFKLNSDLATVPLVLGGAAAAASARLLLAHGARRSRGRFSERRLERLSAARRALPGDRRRAVGGLALFVSYALYVGGASLAAPGLRGTLAGAFASPLGIAVQLVMLAALVALVRIDWTRLLERRAGRGSGGARAQEHHPAGAGTPR